MASGQKSYFIKLAKNRTNALEFTDKPVNDGIIARVLEAARWAPSHHNSQPWKFIVVKNKETIRKLMELAHYGFFHADPSAMIVAIIEPLSEDRKGLLKGKVKEMTDYHYFLTISMPVLNMQYQAEQEGIGSCILSLTIPEANEILNVPKQDSAILTVGLGYLPKKRHIEPKKRKKLSELVYYEKFGRKR